MNAIQSTRSLIAKWVGNNHRSIAFRLIAAVLAVELVASLAAILFSLAYEHHTHFHSFDVMLRGRADSILGAVQDADDPGDNVVLDPADLPTPSDDLWEAFDDRDRLLGRSPNWPSQPKGILAFTPQQFASIPDGNYSSLHLHGRHYRFLVRHGSRTIDPSLPSGGTLRHVTILYGSRTNHVWHAIQGAVEFCALGSLLLLLATGPLMAWLLHRGLLPLRQLAALSARISVDDWHFSPPADARSTPELAPLTQALEQTLNRLHRSFDQQSTFVSDSAHELKTAVAVVKSSLQLLALAPRTPEAYRAGIDAALTDTERLEQLVARMLTLARIEAAPTTDAPASDLAHALQSAASELASVAALHQVRVDLQIPRGETFPVSLALEDAHLLVSNLLLNALQHSPAGSSVLLTLAATPAAVSLTVQDHGDGIPPEALPHIFDRFYRGDPSRARSTGGAGLGLAICHALVTRASGQISIASQPLHGATVSISLPKRVDIHI
ncbi:MAG: HAMP domain-containing sensor histidine kinase [Terracidiphilus sp.]|nr:HAMP domain-containing sensor histidine kinase [Terracidiphilus sp.]